MGNIQHSFLRVPEASQDVDGNERPDDVHIELDIENPNEQGQHNPSAEFRDDNVLFFGAHAFPFNGDNFSLPLHRILNLTPPTKKTRTLKAPFNLIRSSLKLTKTDSEGVFHVTFVFDSTVECRVKLFYCVEEVYDQDGTLRFNHINSDSFENIDDNSTQLEEYGKCIEALYPPGSSIVFKTNDEDVFDTNGYNEIDLTFKSETLMSDNESESDTEEETRSNMKSSLIPIAIVLEAVDSEEYKMISQITFATLLKCGDGSYEAKVYQQKAIIENQTYILYEIFGMDEEQGQVNCVICMTELKNTIVLPCRHMCLCHNCAETLKHQSVKCPMCRGSVKALLKIDVRNNKNQEIEIITDDELE